LKEDYALPESKGEKGKSQMGIGWLLLFIVAWIVLQAYVLPKFGVST